MTKNGQLASESLVVHAGVEENEYLAVVPPIYQTSTFAFDSAEQGAALFGGERQGYVYSRMGNPTVEGLEKSVAALEGGYAGLACGSGMAAIHTTFTVLLQAGDHLVCSDAVYGPTCTLVETVLSRFGIECTMVDTSDLDAVERAMRPNTKVVYIETPGNPTLVICDLEALCRMAHERGAQVVVDNTFMTPILQQPFRWGVDVVVHSLTKFLNGHADVVGGMISFGLRGGLEAGRRMMNAVKLCGLAVSLGGVESLIQHPASMTHAIMGAEARRRANISDGLVRVSVGIENADDIIADLDQAMSTPVA